MMDIMGLMVMTTPAILTLATALLIATEPVAKVPPAVGKEMAEAIIAVNKALGLESWEAHGARPCVDRGGEGANSKDVTPVQAHDCAATVINAKDFPLLGKSYVLAVLMASIGPVTVVAFGKGDAAGWGAYSCDPGRKCLPTKIVPGTKWGKRLVERQAKACGDTTTVWFPADARICEGDSGAPAPATRPPVSP
jgi:hypothetical protein